MDVLGSVCDQKCWELLRSLHVLPSLCERYGYGKQVADYKRVAPSFPIWAHRALLRQVSTNHQCSLLRESVASRSEGSSSSPLFQLLNAHSPPDKSCGTSETEATNRSSPPNLSHGVQPALRQWPACRAPRMAPRARQNLE